MRSMKASPGSKYWNRPPLMVAVSGVKMKSSSFST
jgi:hypothetical protein